MSKGNRADCPEADVVAVRIREERKLAGLTQNELASRAGMSLDAVNRIEMHQRIPNLGTFLNMAKALGISPGVLLEPGNPGPWSRDVARLAAFLEQQPLQVVKVVEACAREIIKGQ